MSLAALTLSRPDEAIIAVMGMTGVGKSSFVSLFTEEAVPIGTGYDSCLLTKSNLNLPEAC
jgi:polynucleotide 5'-kinase involved in rRNA processing